MSDTVMGEVVDFPAPAVRPDDPDDFLTRPGPSADGTGDEDPDGGTDRETVAVDRVLQGVPVDPPDEHRARRGAAVVRAPVIPPSIASRSALAASAAWAVREARYHTAFHAVRAPKYAAKTAVFAPAGMVRTAARLARWASAEDGNWQLRQAAADRG